MQGEVGDAMVGPPGAVGTQGERGRPGPVIDAAGREILNVKGEKVSQVTY